jgi:hypothetical protein
MGLSFAGAGVGGKAAGLAAEEASDLASAETAMGAFQILDHDLPDGTSAAGQAGLTYMQSWGSWQASGAASLAWGQAALLIGTGEAITAAGEWPWQHVVP